MSSYYAPEGGLPPQTRLTTDRARFNEAYVVIPRGSLTDIVSIGPGSVPNRPSNLPRPSPSRRAGPIAASPLSKVCSHDE